MLGKVMVSFILILSLMFVSRRETETFALSYNYDAANLSRALRQAYREGGTIGVLQQQQQMWSTISPISEDCSYQTATTMVHAALDASRGNKGMASGVLNAMIGSCCTMQHPQTGSELASNIMFAYDELNDFFKPDLVALCLAYTATIKHDSRRAQSFLNRATNLYPTTDLSDLATKAPNWDELESRYGVSLLRDSAEYVVLSTPSGMICCHSAIDLSRGDENISLEECLLANGVVLSSLNEEGRGMVHRIDRGTSGCLVLAKTNECHALLVSHFFLRKVQKSYQALVHLFNSTNYPLSDQGVVTLPIQGRPAMSSYVVEEHVSPLVARLRIVTTQGRKHQVRLHCSKGLKTPILLDPLYGGEAILFKMKSPILHRLRAEQKFCLHAASLVIPDFGIDVQAPIPDWWQEVVTAGLMR